MARYECFNEEELPFDSGNTGLPCKGDGEDTELLCESDGRSYEFADDCLDSCAIVKRFLHLTDKMLGTIIGLEEEVVRWRQALIKYLPKDWAEGFRQDIFNNLSVDFEGDPAYDLYVKLRGGVDPQQARERIKRLYRLADGTDDTSIKYL